MAAAALSASTSSWWQRRAYVVPVWRIYNSSLSSLIVIGYGWLYKFGCIVVKCGDVIKKCDGVFGLYLCFRCSFDTAPARDDGVALLLRYECWGGSWSHLLIIIVCLMAGCWFDVWWVRCSFDFSGKISDLASLSTTNKPSHRYKIQTDHTQTTDERQYLGWNSKRKWLVACSVVVFWEYIGNMNVW